MAKKPYVVKLIEKAESKAQWAETLVEKYEWAMMKLEESYGQLFSELVAKRQFDAADMLTSQRKKALEFLRERQAEFGGNWLEGEKLTAVGRRAIGKSVQRLERAAQRGRSEIVSHQLTTEYQQWQAQQPTESILLPPAMPVTLPPRHKKAKGKRRTQAA
ncbi:MAG: hypothetical protein ABH846_00885 [Patescibacteria group bacterium]